MAGDLEWFMQCVVLHVVFYGDYDAVLKVQYLCSSWVDKQSDMYWSAFKCIDLHYFQQAYPVIQYFGKYTCSQSSRDFDEKNDSTLMSVL